MTKFETVLKTSELAPGDIRAVTVGETEIAVANVDGRYCAFGSICPHEEAPLVDGEIEDGAVVCPWHFTRFDVNTGAVIEGVTDEPIPVYEVRVVGDEVQVAGPEKK